MYNIQLPCYMHYLGVVGVQTIEILRRLYGINGRCIEECGLLGQDAEILILARLCIQGIAILTHTLYNETLKNPEIKKVNSIS